MRHAALRRVDVALERGADAERDEREVVLGADAHDLLHVLGRLRVDHRVGRLVGHPGERIAVLLAHGERGDHAVAEGGGERGERLLGGGRVAAVCCGGVSQGHAAFPLLGPFAPDVSRGCRRGETGAPQPGARFGRQFSEGLRRGAAPDLARNGTIIATRWR